jgi:hypothetical protein
LFPFYQLCDSQFTISAASNPSHLPVRVKAFFVPFHRIAEWTQSPVSFSPARIYKGLAPLAPVSLLFARTLFLAS